MNIQLRHIYRFTLAGFALLSACVPARKFEEIKAKQDRCEADNALLKSQNEDLTVKMTELGAELTDFKKRHEGLVGDTAVLGKSLRQMTQNYDKLNETYELLLKNNKEMLAGSRTETEKLMTELQKTQSNLQKQEDALKLLERELQAKQKDLERNSQELSEREAKINELQGILEKKDKAVEDLRKKVSDALLGFENKGLTIEQKNGKVYVSLEENLLFASGSYQVDTKGKEALKKLAGVLADNQDINVLVEGHTDNVPYKGSGQIKDNWDLSVLRATAIVRILTENKGLDPKRLTAAGRGEYLPIDPSDSKEARQKNRRTEIILTPKLDELLQILESN
ncbi:MAG: OmpA family protein [Flavobacteriales bacterium]|nr:OmpA family protein [Flavobacteriales bacterium]MCB9449731.1 OmpA family protein [Flavobacteriales bacterium]